jgi:hypothetical protein
LAKVLWLDVVEPRLVAQHERRRLVPVPTVHPAVAMTTLMGAAATRVQRSADGAVTFGGDDWTGTLPPSAAVYVAESALGLDQRCGGRVIGGLVAWLARNVWERWQGAEDRFDYVPMPAGRNELRDRVLGFEVTEDEVDRALEWLMAERIGGLPVVSAVHAEEHSGERGGRPRKSRVVQVGAPLAPMGLASVFKAAGAAVPSELRFYGFVLDPLQAPLIGYRPTYARQRDAYSLFLGLHLMRRREEYADRGGVRLEQATWRAALKQLGIYHRTHQSLADDVLEAYLKPRGELWAQGPVLVEATAGSGVYRLGPDYADQHEAILAAAGVSRKQRRRAKGAGAQSLRGKGKRWGHKG